MAEKEDIESFERWKVQQLTEFCQKRGLPVNGKKKKELVAMVYCASLQNLPVILTVSDQKTAAKAEYRRLLEVGEETLPDPLAHMDGWIGEGDGTCLWPPCMAITISMYLVDQGERPLLSRLQNDYKEGKAFSYFASRQSWVHEVLYHPISAASALCFLKTTVTPSQRVNSIAHNVWVCLQKENGNIKTAYCSCFAGLGRTCNHIAALLFKVDYAWQNGLSNVHQKPCTSKENTWLAPVLKKMEPMMAMDMVVQKPHYRPKKRLVAKSHTARKLFDINRSRTFKKTTLETLAAALYHESPTGVAWQFALPHAQPDYEPDDPVNVAMEVECIASSALPPTLPELATQFRCGEEMWSCLPVYTLADVDAIQNSTMAQHTSETWHSYRVGRITASFAHNVMTKYRPSGANKDDFTRLIDIVLRKNNLNSDLPALKYGRQNEPLAVEHYFNTQRRHHSNLKIQDCGLFVSINSTHIGASPDRLVTCTCCGEGLLEVKCPISLAGKSPFKESVSCLNMVNGKLQLNRKHQYYSQVQFQLGVTSKAWCDFMIFCGTDYFLERIYCDQTLWEELFLASTRFFREHVCDALVNSNGANCLSNQQ